MSVRWELQAVTPGQAEHERVVDQVLALSDPPNRERYRNYLLGLKDDVLREKLVELTRERESDPYHRRLGRSLRSVVRATPGVCA